MINQRARASRILPLEVEEVDSKVPKPSRGRCPSYEFEPGAEAVLDQLLPKYVTNRIYFALLESAASQHASRRAAMKAATDNAEELVKTLTRQANQARQAEITNEISEIVGGADALAAASAGSEYREVTATAEGTAAPTTVTGRIARVIGPVVDVEFPVGSLPRSTTL